MAKPGVAEWANMPLKQQFPEVFLSRRGYTSHICVCRAGCTFHDSLPACLYVSEKGRQGMSEENSWLGRRVVAAGATLLAVGTLAWAAPALASSGGDPQATVVDDASTINWVTPDDAGGPPPLPDDMGENPRPGMDPVGAPEKRHGAAEGEVLAPPVKVDPECAPADDCVTLWVWAASMMVDPDITIRQMNAWRAQAAEKGACNAEGESIAGEPLVWSDSLAFAAQELAVELALGADPATLERLDGSGSVINGEGNTFFPNTHITGVNISNLTSIQGTLDAWYVQSEAYWYGPQSTVYYTTGDYANAVSNEAKAVGMASVMLSNQEVYTVCLFGDAAPEEVDGTTYAPMTGGAIYQGVNVQKDKLIFELVAPETLTVGEPVELGINASTTLTGNAVGRAAGVAIDPTELFEQATVQVVQDGKVVGEIAGGKLRALGGFVSGPATLQVVMADEVVASAEVEVVAVPTALGESATIISMVPSGDTFELPQTMSVLWTGGATTDEPVTWEALTDEQLAMLKSREGGSFEVAGTVETLGEDVTVKVTVLPAVPVYADMPPAQEIWVGGTPALPETLTVTWSNGDVSDEPVAWDELDTTVAGTLAATGTIEGLSSPVTAQVTVKPLEVASVEGQDVELDIASGEMNADALFVALPATAAVSWSDGSVTEEPIAWSALPGEQEAALSSRGGAAFTLSGVVGETGVAASAKIKVEAATMVSAEAVPAQEVWVGGAPELPGTVAVTWSNGDVTDEPVSWGAADTSQPGALEVQGAVEGLADPVVAAVEVRAPEAVSAGDGGPLAASVPSGSSAADALAALPQTVPVSWSDGSVTEEPVAWAEPDAEQLAALSSREGGTVEVQGAVGDTGQAVSATVEVAPAEPVSAQAPQAQEVWVGGAPELPGTVAVTWSNGDVTDEPVSWGAADTSQPGALEVQGAVEGLADPVVAAVEVRAPEAVSAGDGGPLAASVPSGSSAADALAALPQTVPVSWSDGSVTEEPVAWAEPDAEQLAALSSREGGTVEVQGAVGDTGQAVSATVEVAPAEPVSAQAPQAQEVWVGGAPELPGTVAVTWSNGDVTDEPVSWGAADTSQPGALEVQGAVEGLADPVVAAVEVRAPEAVSAGDGGPLAASVPSGSSAADALAALPQTVPVSWSDGSVTEEPVAWAEPDAEQLAALSSREGGTVEVQGAVGDTGQAVSATVEVAPAEPVSAQAPQAQEVWVGGAPELPGTVAVTWSNGDVTDEPVSWGAADTSQPGALEVQGAVEGLADPVVAAVDVKAPEAVSAELSDVEAQTLEVEPGAVPDLPATVQVSWSDGQTSEESVVWDVPSAEEFVAGTDVKISGEVETTQQSVEVTVHVKDEEPAPAPQAEPDSDKDAAAATDTKTGEDDAASQAAASPTKPGAAAEQADQGDSTPEPDAAATQDDKADQAATAPQPQPAAPEKSHATDVTSSGERQQAGLPAWVIATLAGLGAAFVAAVAFVVSKRRRVEDDEPIGKHAAPKNK